MAPKLKEMGVDVIACLATNDAWTMQAWGEQQGAIGKVRMLSDVSGDLNMALGTTKPPSGMVTRSKRYSMIIVDNKVAAFHDGDANGSECTYADAILKSLPEVLAKSVDPLEAFCAEDPSADECRCVRLPRRARSAARDADALPCQSVLRLSVRLVGAAAVARAAHRSVNCSSARAVCTERIPYSCQQPPGKGSRAARRHRPVDSAESACCS